MIEERIVWELDSAPVREQLRIRASRTDGPIRVHAFEREILARKPEDHEGVSYVLRAIEDLGTCRPIGLTLGPIPITAIWEYLRRKGFDAMATEIMTSAILHGDRVYLTHRAKKAAA